MKQNKKIQFKLKQNRKKIFLLFGLFFMLAALFYVGVGVVRAGDDTEDQISDTKDEIKKLEKTKKKKETIKNSYVQNASILKGHINRLVGNINSVKKEAERVNEEIDQAEKNIENKQKQIQISRVRVSKILREISYYKREMRLIVLDDRKGLEEYIRVQKAVEELQKKAVGDLYELKEEKKSLEKDKADKDALKDKLLSEKNSLEGEKQKKNSDLYSVNKQIAIKDKEIKAINRKINALQSALSSFLGKSFNAKDIVEAVKFASKRTGVRKEFLMAMLDKETDLGRFTGGCTYKNTKMRSTDKKIFKSICKELGYNYKKKKISCALSYGYGGAMGVAQFMPSTWLGYKSAITRYTGHNPPDPWSLTDGVMGMAEKLKRGGADRKKGEHYAAKLYYCGSPRSKYWDTHCEVYADKVASWAKGGYDEYF